MMNIFYGFIFFTLILNITYTKPLWSWIDGSSDLNDIDDDYDESVLGRRHSVITSMSKSKQILYLFGGRSNSDSYGDLWKYDFIEGIWKNIYIYDGHSNKPLPCHGGVSWVDETKNELYIFGGEYIESGSRRFLHGLWKYIINNGKWECLLNDCSSYNIKGNYYDQDGYPGSRAYPIYWLDEEYFYIYGGLGCDISHCNVILRDFWRYEIENNKWNFISGGTECNDTDSFNSRIGSFYWFDQSNKLWIYGGRGIDQYYYADLWYFDFDFDQWHKIKGSTNILPDYENNHPGSRGFGLSWFNKEKNELWMFGGLTYHEGEEYSYNDIWKYSIDNNEWKWEGGKKELSNKGNYGEKNGDPSDHLFPHSKGYIGAWYDYENNKIYSFGGLHKGESGDKHLNDLWLISLVETNEDEDECESSTCYIDDEIYINETIIVDYELIISNESVIIIPSIIKGKPAIINNGDDPIIIDGGLIFFEFDDVNEYEDLLESIRKNKKYEYIIIDGRYEGSFDDIKIKTPSDFEECEELKAELKEEKDKYIVLFTIESTCSKLKWWIILLIVIGIVIVLAIGLILLIVLNKNLRSKVLPFRKRRTQTFDEKYEGRNDMYKGKGKVNPLFES